MRTTHDTARAKPSRLRRLGRSGLGLFLASTLALAACGTGGPAYTRGPETADAIVEMTSDLAFAPATVTVRAGQVVEWRNVSLFTHTATFDPTLADDPAHVEQPDGVEPFHSGDVPPGEIARRRFDMPGTYRYVCLPHEGFGMRGTVVVRAAE